jgi:hypothetical protein
VEAVLHGDRDPGLMAAAKRGAILSTGGAAAGYPRDRQPAGRPGAEQGAPAERHQRWTIVPPTRESGSASASTAWLRRRRWAASTVE